METKINVGSVSIGLNDLIGQSIYITGVRGSGKSYLEGVLLEEMMASGIPCLVVDSEGDSEGVALPNVKLEGSLDALARSVAYNVMRFANSYRIDATDATKQDRIYFIYVLSEYLLEYGKTYKNPMFLFVDEVEYFAGQKSRALEAFTDLITLGRKRGIGIVMAGHRIARIDKDVLGECTYAFFKKTTLDIDLDRIGKYLKNVSGEDYTEQILTMKPNEALFVDTNEGEVKVIEIKQRLYEHHTNTPRQVRYYEYSDFEMMKHIWKKYYLLIFIAFIGLFTLTIPWMDLVLIASIVLYAKIRRKK